MKKQTGFTLIEIMIVIVIFAIIMPTHYSLSRAVQVFARRDLYKQCGIIAQRTFLKIKQAGNYPPEVRNVPQDLKITLSNKFYPDSVEVYCGGDKIPVDKYQADSAANTVTFDNSLNGKTVAVNYKMPIRGWEEIRRIPAQPPYKIILQNTTVEEIISVKLAQGNNLIPLEITQYKLNSGENSIEFEANAGKTVLITYTGKLFGGYITGAFTSGGMTSETFNPTNLKVLKLNIGISGEKECLNFFTIKRI